MTAGVTRQWPDESSPDRDVLDEIRALLVSILTENTPLDRDAIYSYIFAEGKKIIWN